jgi:hypothetical protein
VLCFQRQASGKQWFWWLISTSSLEKRRLPDQAFLEGEIDCVRGIYGAELGIDQAYFPVDGVSAHAKTYCDFHFRIAPRVPSKDLKLSPR